MGLFRNFLIRVFEALLIFFIIAYLPGIPPNMTFTSSPSRLNHRPLTGPLALNTRLNNAEHLFEGLLHGPEGLATRPMDDSLYVSVYGQVVKISGPNGDELSAIAQFGKPCEGHWEEDVCGRPLGMEFGPDGFLYVADAFYGIFKLNVDTGKYTQLVSADEEVEGKKPGLFNSLAVARDGTIYWTDSFYEGSLKEGGKSLFADGSGRLIRWDPITKINTVLMDKLWFTNGVVLSPKEDFVLVAESFAFQIHRYWLKGPKQNQTDIFVDGLPGAPDNLKPRPGGGYWAPLIMSADRNNPFIPDVLRPYSLLRKFLARLLCLMELPFKQINHVYPNQLCKKIEHWIGHFTMFSPFMYNYRATIVELDSDGTIINSLHALDGLSGICDLTIWRNQLVLGSPFNYFLGRVPLPPGMKTPKDIKPTTKETSPPPPPSSTPPKKA